MQWISRRRMNLLITHHSIVFIILILRSYTFGLRTRDEENSSNLVLVQIVSRHGLRAPEFPYPTDPFSNVSQFWPNGWGQLTELGKEQEFQLGQFFRKRYGNFLSPVFSPNEVFAISSNYERTILSAQLVLAGIFSSDKSHKFGSYIPVHSIPKSFDKMINPNPACPRRKELYEAFLESDPSVLEHYEEHKTLFDEIRKNMGYGPDIRNEMYNSIGSLKIQQIYNLSIPAWAESLLASKIHNISKAFKYLTGSETLKRLTVGPILSNMVDNMIRKVSGKESRKMFFYSGHDMTIASILNTLQVYDGHWPNFSSSILFELYYQNSSQEYILKIYYKNSTDEEMTLFELPKCPNQCTLQNFKTQFQRYLPTSSELDAECQLENSNYLSTLDAVLVATVFVLGILLIAILATIFSRAGNKNREYQINA